MQSIQISSQKASLDEVLSGLSELELSVLEPFLQQVAVLVAKKKTPSLSKEETELLLIINKDLPKKLHEKYRYLSDKMNFGKISDSEHKELLKIVEKMEKRDVERLEALVKLSLLREISFDQLVEDLGIKPAHVK